MEGFLNLHPREWFATQDDDYLSAMLTSPQYEFHSGGGVANPGYGQPTNNIYPDSTYLDNTIANTYPANLYSNNTYPNNTYPTDVVEVEYGFDGKHLIYSDPSRSPRREYLSQKETLGACVFDYTEPPTGDVCGWSPDNSPPAYTKHAGPDTTTATTTATPAPGYDITADLLSCGNSNSVLTDYADSLQLAHFDYGPSQTSATQLQQATYEYAPAGVDQPAPAPAYAYVNPADVFPAPYPGSPASSGSTSPALSSASPVFSEFSLPLTSSSTQTSWSSDSAVAVAADQAWLMPEMLPRAAGTCASASALFSPVAGYHGCEAPALTQLSELSLPSLLSSSFSPAAAAEYSGFGLNRNVSLLSQSQSQCHGDQLGHAPRQTISKPRGGQQVAKKRARDEDDGEFQLPAKKSRVGQSLKPTPKNNIKKRSAHGAESLARRATSVALRSPKCKAMDATTGGQIQSHIHGSYHTGEVEGPEKMPFGQTPQTKKAVPRLYCAPCKKTFKRPVELTRHLTQTKRHSAGFICPMDGCTRCLSRPDAVLRHLCGQHPGWEAIITWRPSEQKRAEA